MNEQIEAAQEYLSGVSNQTELMNALSHLPESAAAAAMASDWGQALAARVFGEAA